MLWPVYKDAFLPENRINSSLLALPYKVCADFAH